MNKHDELQAAHNIVLFSFDVSRSQVSFRDLLHTFTPVVHVFVTDEEVHGACDKDRRIPQLKEVFERFPDVPINVDIKHDSDKLISEVRQSLCHSEGVPWLMTGVIASLC